MKNNSLIKPFLYVGICIALLMLALLFFNLIKEYLHENAQFNIKKVVVTNKGAASESEIMKAANIPLGVNILNIDLDKVKVAVEAHPWVKAASISRALPDTILISYIAEEAQAILNFKGLYYVNADGIPFYKLQNGDSLRYPYISVADQIGSLKNLSTERIKLAIELLMWARNSRVLSLEDIGDLSIRTRAFQGLASLHMTAAYPPKKMRREAQDSWHYISLSFAVDGLAQQKLRAEKILDYLYQENMQASGIRLELGKKVIVKIR